MITGRVKVVLLDVTGNAHLRASPGKNAEVSAGQVQTTLIFSAMTSELLRGECDSQPLWAGLLFVGSTFSSPWCFPPSINSQVCTINYASYKPLFHNYNYDTIDLVIVMFILLNAYWMLVTFLISLNYLHDPCIRGKHHQLLFHISNTHYTQPLQLVFIDIWDPAPVCASNAAKYYISFLDVTTRYTWLFLLHHNSQALDTLIRFK